MAKTNKQRKNLRFAHYLDNICQKLGIGKSRGAREIRAADRRLEQRKRKQFARNHETQA